MMLSGQRHRLLLFEYQVNLPNLKTTILGRLPKTSKENATPTGEPTQWKTRALLAAGVGVPLGILAMADPAAADLNDFDPSLQESADTNADVIDPTGSPEIDRFENSSNFGSFADDVIDPLESAHDVVPSEFTQDEDLIMETTLIPIASIRFDGNDTRRSITKSINSSTTEDGWYVTQSGDYPYSSVRRFRTFDEPQPSSVSLTFHHQSDPADPTTGFNFFSQRQVRSTMPYQSGAATVVENNKTDREIMEVLGGDAGLYLDQSRHTKETTINGETASKSVSFGTFEGQP